MIRTLPADFAEITYLIGDAKAMIVAQGGVDRSRVVCRSEPRVGDYTLELGSASRTAAVYTELAWHVLYVKSRQEKALASDLDKLGISHYLPLVDKVTFYGSRRFRVRIPLFPGYLFLRGDPSQVIEADRTGRLVRVIHVNDQKQITAELANIQLAMQQGADLGPHRMIREGWKVRVQSGPLEGLQGIVEGRLKTNRLILQVLLLGQAVSTEIDDDLLEVLSPA